MVFPGAVGVAGGTPKNALPRGSCSSAGDCGFDTETHLITGDNPFPRLVCATFDINEWGNDGEGESWINTNSCDDLLIKFMFMFEECWKRRRHKTIPKLATYLGSNIYLTK